MSVASVTNKTLQLAELVISNEKFFGATGYVASSSTFSSSVNGTSLNTSDIVSTGNITTERVSGSGVGGSLISTTGGGTIDIGVVGNVGGTTYDTDGTLTITRNVSNGNNEFDFVAINYNTTTGMNFYASTVEVNNATLPSLSVKIDGIKPLAIIDDNNATGTAGQVLTAQGNGTFLWATPA